MSKSKIHWEYIDDRLGNDFTLHKIISKHMTILPLLIGENGRSLAIAVVDRQ
jgi:hypothetical protein